LRRLRLTQNVMRALWTVVYTDDINYRHRIHKDME